MIFSIQEKGGLENISNPIEFLKDKFAINFENYTIEQINSEFMKFLYCIMDKYSESKDKIIMPQTKIIDFITRAKI